MKLLMDEQLSPRIAAILRQRSHDAVAAREQQGRPASERALWERAIAEERVMVTCDGEEFPPIYTLFSQAGVHHPGLVVVAAPSDAAEAVTGIADSLDHLGESDEDLTDQIVFLRPPGTARLRKRA